jgi:hypothetical protein
MPDDNPIPAATQATPQTTAPDLGVLKNLLKNISMMFRMQ